MFQESHTTVPSSTRTGTKISVRSVSESYRLQKTACLLEMAGAGFGFKFSYHLYGPYSEDLTIAASDADALDIIDTTEKQAEWGGHYFVYQTNDDVADLPAPIRELAALAAKSDSIELELAVTAGFLAKNGTENPWDEVISRKRAKATPERIERARTLYRSFARRGLPNALPTI